jgi:hypothetical protein
MQVEKIGLKMKYGITIEEMECDRCRNLIPGRLPYVVISSIREVEGEYAFYEQIECVVPCSTRRRLASEGSTPDYDLSDWIQKQAGAAV